MEDDLKGSSVLVVDDSAETLRLLVALLRRGGFVPRPVLSGNLAIEAARSEPPDLVLLDVAMPAMSGLEVCRRLKLDERLRSIPVIFVSGGQGAAENVEALRAGGVDHVTRPIQEDEVLARVRTHLRLRRLQVELASHALHLEERIAERVEAATASHRATIFALAKLAEAREDDTGKHCERVRTFSRLLAERMRELTLQAERLTSDYVDHLFQAAPLHDIGEVAIPDAVLLKPGRLTADELAEMKRHCEIGAVTLAEVLERHPDNPFLKMGVDVARSHHERWDGSGYPDRLGGTAIPLSARIVALADSYDAVTSKRCYRPACSEEDACRMIDEGRGKHFDPDVVESFRTLKGEFHRIRQRMES